MPISPRLILGLSALALQPGLLAANSLRDALPYIDADGSFVAYMDFDGDGLEIGTELNAIYAAVLEANAQIPPIPLDFPSLFETLGYGSIKSFALSSKELEDGLVRNRSVTLLDGEPTGLMSLYAMQAQPFAAARLAPADATTVLSSQIRLDALRDTVVALLTQVMGPMGEGLAQQQLGNPLPNTDVTPNEVLDALSGRLDLIMRQGLRADGQPDFAIWASIDGAGSLLARLEPLSGMIGAEFVETPAGLEVDLSALLEGTPFGLFLQAPTGQDKLLVFTDRAWAGSIGQGGASLADQPEFQRVISRLPKQAAMYSYTRGIDPRQILDLVAQVPDVQPYLPVIEKAIDLLVGDFLAPSGSALYRQGDALIGEQYAEYSYKQVLTVLPAAVVGAVAGMAIPAYQKVQLVSQEKAVTNNLRMIASASQQYMLDQGVTEVTLDMIVGEDKFIHHLESVVGESYDDIVVTADTTELSVTLPDGRVITYQF